MPGPYWLDYRKKWLKQLLEIELKFNQEGHKIQLITEPELHAIRQEWLRDPNEPDWSDSLPKIYKEVYGKDLNWIIDDQSHFDESDAQLLQQLAPKYDIEAEMVMKLIELEVSLEGISRRQGIFNKIENILKQDWGKNLAEIEKKQAELQKRHEKDIHQEEIASIENELKNLHSEFIKIDSSISLLGKGH